MSVKQLFDRGWKGAILRRWIYLLNHREKVIQHGIAGLLYYTSKSEKAWDVYSEIYKQLFGVEYDYQKMIEVFEQIKAQLSPAQEK